MKNQKKEEIKKELAEVRRINIWKNIKENIVFLEDAILNKKECKNHNNDLLDTLYKLERLFNPLILPPDDSILDEADIEELVMDFFHNNESSTPPVRSSFYYGY